MQKYAAIVIGSGPAGQTCAARLAQLGVKVAVVERDYVGGICTNWGCTPSKAMIESAKVAATVANSDRYGIHVTGCEIDFEGVASRRDAVIARSRALLEELLMTLGVDIYQGEAEIAGPGRVRVRRGKLDRDGWVMHYTGEIDEIEAEHIVLATGSQPLYPSFVPRDDPRVVSSNRLITIEALPETLTIIGGGVIGLEFATIFSNLGSRVTIVEFKDRVLPLMDPEVSAALHDAMAAKGVRVLANHRVVDIRDGVVWAEDCDTGEIERISSETVLVAIGRQPVIERGMFDALGIGYSHAGIEIDDHLRTTVPNIWAIGDATGKSILAHVGIQQGIICAENIAAALRGDAQAARKMDYSVIPTVVYSMPEVAAVGEVPPAGEGVKTYTVPFSANLRARIEDHEEGFVKIWLRDGRLVAAQAVGHNVSETMQELANVIALRTPVEDVANIIHAHPTYSEIARSALEYSLGKAVDFLPAR